MGTVRALRGSLGLAWVHSGAHCSHWVPSGSGEFTRARLGVARFILVCFGLVGRVQKSPGLFGFVWVHALCLPGSFGFKYVHSARLDFTVFVRVRLGLLTAHKGGLVHSCSLRFTQRTLRSPGSFGLAWIHSARIVVAGFIRVRVGSLGPTYQFHSGSRWFTQARLGVSGFIWIRIGSLGRA